MKRINQRIHNEGFRSEGVNWDGRDDFGEQLAKGVYVYNLSITNEQEEQRIKLKQCSF